MNKAIQRGALCVGVLFAGIVAAVCVILWQQPKPIDFLSRDISVELRLILLVILVGGFAACIFGLNSFGNYS